MKIMIHDFVGHPFQLGLATELAAAGHHIDYVYFASEPGPKGDFEKASALPKPPHIHGLRINGEYRKDAFLSRRANDLDYARQFDKLMDKLKPDIVLSGNVPTEVQDYVLRACKRNGSAFILWMQDFYSIAATKLLGKKLGFLGRAIGGYWRWLDRKHLRASDWIVLITEDFRPLASDWAKRSDRIDIVENWGALDEIPLRPHDNDWSRQQGIAESFNFLYSGTLGLKHNPELLAALAETIGDDGTVTVASMGASVPYLQKRKEEAKLDNLAILPLQPFAMLPDMLASADVLVATIEPDAGTFSVPSKVLSYLCAGRPILLAAPLENLASRIVERAGAGLVVAPDDQAAFLAAARMILANPNRGEMGKRGRAYAEAHFDLNAVVKRFESIFDKARAHKRGN